MPSSSGHCHYHHRRCYVWRRSSELAPAYRKISQSHSKKVLIIIIIIIMGTRGSVAGWGIMLLAGSWRVPVLMRWIFNLRNLSSSIMALGPTQPLTEMSTSNLPEGVKGGRRVRLTILPPSVSRLSRENVEASTSHNPMGLHGLLEG
jgi:hypothetical protein